MRIEKMKKRATDLLISCLLPINKMMIRTSCKVMRKSNKNSVSMRGLRT